jgi:hypothetical protein
MHQAKLPFNKQINIAIERMNRSYFLQVTALIVCFGASLASCAWAFLAIFHEAWTTLAWSGPAGILGLLAFGGAMRELSWHHQVEKNPLSCKLAEEVARK